MQTKLSDGSVMICGILGRDAEYKQVGQNNSSLTRFSVKVGERPPAQQGERGEAIWANCQAWHSVARACAGLKKLDVVLCVGKIEKHTADDGKVYSNLVCEFVIPMTSAQNQTTTTSSPSLPDNLDGFEEVLTDDGVPF